MTTFLSQTTVELVATDDGRMVYDWTAAESVAEAVVDAVRSATDVDHDDISLYDSIDTEALDALFQSRYDGSSTREGCVSFPVEDLDVTVSTDGTLVLQPRDCDASQSPPPVDNSC